MPTTGNNRLWSRRDRDELEQWYEEKVAKGLIDGDSAEGLRRKWSIRRHAIRLRT